MKIRILLFSATLAVCACAGDDDAPADASIKAHADASVDEHPDAQSDASESCTATINLVDYKLDPKDIEAQSGKVTLCAVNKGVTSHDLGVRDASKKTLGITKKLSPGDEDRFTVDLSAATYDIYCSQGGHESLGMKGTLTVK